MTASRRREYVDIDVNVHTTESVPIAYVLEQLSEEAMISELEKRGRFASLGAEESLAEEALGELRRGNIIEATVVLERALRPKFSSLEECKKRYDESRARAN